MKNTYREDIKKILDRIPDENLEILFIYLKEIENKSKIQIDNSHLINKILTEDAELLRKLAQ